MAAPAFSRHGDRPVEQFTRHRPIGSKASRMKYTLFGKHQRNKRKIVTFANPEVLTFYKTLPFNFRESVASSTEAIRSQDPRLAYPVLGPLLHANARVLDVGCGV